MRYSPGMSDHDALAPFVGLWSLAAADQDGGHAEPALPTRGVYTVLASPGGFAIHARSTDASGETRQLGLRGILDGRPYPLSSAPPRQLIAALEPGALVLRVVGGDGGGGEGGDLHRVRHTRAGDTLVVEEETRVGDGWQTTRAEYRPTSTKQVILYRRDLKMRKGKIAAQCAHAAMAVFFRRNQGEPGELRIPLDGPMAIWSAGRFTKIVLSVEGEDELLAAHTHAQQAGLPTALITDAGKTEFAGVPTRTTVALGPAASEEIDRISGPGGLVPTKLA
ncbi:MAG: hypothetical protein Tsb0020_31020 [Haliangiales bacterium]